MPLEDSASAVLGPDPRLQSAPVRFSPVSGVASGSQGGAIPSHVFNAMDRKHMQRAEEILTFKDRVATLKDRESARVQGNMAMGQISNLDPSQPDYLQKRNAIISRYPKAMLDDTANKFLDVQEDLYDQEQGKREYDRQRQTSFDLEMQRIEAYSDRDEERAAAISAREQAREVRGMDSSAQDAYFAAVGRGMEAGQAYILAQSLDEQAKYRNQFLSEGGLRSELFVDEDGAERPRTEGELAELLGSRKRQKAEREFQKNRIDDLDDQLRDVDSQIKMLNSDLTSEAVVDLEDEDRNREESRIREKIATLRNQGDTYREQLANLRGLRSEGQSAPPSSSPAEGGSTTGTSSITGQRFVQRRSGEAP